MDKYEGHVSGSVRWRTVGDLNYRGGLGWRKNKDHESDGRYLWLLLTTAPISTLHLPPTCSIFNAQGFCTHSALSLFKFLTTVCFSLSKTFYLWACARTLCLCGEFRGKFNIVCNVHGICVHSLHTGTLKFIEALFGELLFSFLDDFAYMSVLLLC